MKMILGLFSYKLISKLIPLLLISSITLYSQDSYIIYGTDSGSPASAVYRMKTDGTESTAIWTAPNTSTYIEAVAFDASINKVYFYKDNASFDNGEIYRCNLDGSSLEMFLDISSHGGVTRMAAANGYLYYAPVNGTSLKRINSDGTNDTTIYSGPTGISDIALDIANDYLFFVEKGNGGSINYYNLYRSDLNGGSRTSIYTTSNNYYLGGLSAGNGYVFFHRGDVHDQQRINNDGSNVQTVYTVSGGAVNNGAYDEYNKNLYFSYNQEIYKGSANGTGATVIKDVVQFIGFGANIDVAPNISALPVELTSFDETASENSVYLNWQTATEVNNYGFQVQRKKIKDISEDEWETLGFVQGNGTTNSPKNYEFTDSLNLTLNPNLNRIDYRLKQIDNDGTFTYSKTVTVDLSTITSVEDEEIPTVYSLSQNYPNPFNPTTKISFTIPTSPRPSPYQGEGDKVKLVVYDILGREVATLVNQKLQAGYHEVSFDGSNLSSGMYFYSINIGDKFMAIKKMLMVK